MEFRAGKEGTCSSWEGAASACVCNPSTWGKGSRAHPAASKGCPVFWAGTEPCHHSLLDSVSLLTLELHGCSVTFWYRINGVQQILRYWLWGLIFHCRCLLTTKKAIQPSLKFKKAYIQNTRIQNSRVPVALVTLNHRGCTKEKLKGFDLLLSHGF